ncbi:hypothetical protein [Streptomyces sp. cg2]|uniref:hypothetical protein n=1 Tax=Streptomyces sp. cg2 TaxID=3238799 RepID=UPI0034E20316
MTPPKDRNVPSGTSPLSGQPKLTPKVGRLKVGEHSDQEPEQQQGTAPQLPRPGRSRGGRRPAPAADGAVATTVRLDPDEATEVDLFVLMLRDEARRTRLDKAEVYRELLRLAREDDAVRRKLLRRL